MAIKLETPQFASEAEEADWWYDNRERIDDFMSKAMAEGNVRIGVPTPPELRGVPLGLQLTPEDENKARALAEKNGMSYQAYLTLLVRRELARPLDELIGLNKEKTAA